MRLPWLCAIILSLAPIAAHAENVQPARFQYELLGASHQWVVLRENLPASTSDTAACSYPGIDAAEYVGVRVHFFKLSAEAQKGRLTPFNPPTQPMPLYTPAHDGEHCTAPADSEARWRAIVQRAGELRVSLPAKPPVPKLLGDSVEPGSCEVLSLTQADTARCSRLFSQTINGSPFRLAVSVTAVPEAPDPGTCQYVGDRMGVAIQIAGIDFGTVDSQIAPGGFITHVDCRKQLFEPLRLYELSGLAVLLGGFKGSNIADRNEYPFLIVFPTHPTP